MDPEIQARFLNHIFQFFAPLSQDEGTGVISSSKLDADAADVGVGKCPDLPVLLGVLRAAGFLVKFSDKSDFGGSTTGCRAIILCKRSGTRVVMDGEGPCTCLSEDLMRNLLDGSNTKTSNPSQPSSRATSPLPSASCLEDPLKTKEPDGDAPPGKLRRQRTWSRDEEVRQLENRRLSAPPAPAQSSWVTFNGDELNVLAAKDLLQEAMSLLAGVKKVNLRNTPVGPTRRLSAMASRRVSSDAFTMPQRPLSRTSSTSSGVASTKSSASLQSNQSQDTPRPTTQGGRPAAASLRRTLSAVSGGSAGKTRAAASKKGGVDSKLNSTFVSKAPSSLKGTPGAGNRSLIRSTSHVGVKTTSSIIASNVHPSTETPRSTENQIAEI